VVTLLTLLASPLSLSAQPRGQGELPPALRAAPEVEEIPGAHHEAPREPMAVRVDVGFGSSLRLVQNHDFDQSRFAPAYLSARAAFQWRQRGRWRHGVGLGVVTNLSGDGSFQAGLDPVQQWVLTPLYVLEWRMSDDPVPLFDLAATVGLPLALTPDFSLGGELDLTFTTRILAGLGAYVSVGASAFLGGQSRAGDLTLHPLLSAELGLALRYELLP